MTKLQPQEYRISSGRTGEDKAKIAAEHDRIFGPAKCAVHGGNEEIESYQERSARALAEQQKARGMK